MVICCLLVNFQTEKTKQKTKQKKKKKKKKKKKFCLLQHGCCEKSQEFNTTGKNSDHQSTASECNYVHRADK